jgi:hypothetical protein
LEQLGSATVVVSLRVFTLSLNILLQLFELIDLRLERPLIDWSSAGSVSELADLRLKRCSPLLHLSNFVFELLKFSIQFGHKHRELQNAGLRIKKRIGVDYRHLGHRKGTRRGGRRSRRWR